MSSLRRTLSFQANGALSRGPVTLEGKQRSAMNASSHGLLARTTLMRGEWSDGLENIFNQYVDWLAPVDAVEYGYVEEMVAASWRLRAIETRTLDNEADAQTAGDPLDRIAAAFAPLAEKPHPDLLHRYEMRMHLTYQRALHNQILRRTAGPNPVPFPDTSTWGHPHREIPNEPSKLLKTMERANESNPFSEEPGPRTCITKTTRPPGLPWPRRQKALPQLPSLREPLLRCVCSLSRYTVVSELGYGEPTACRAFFHGFPAGRLMLG